MATFKYDCPQLTCRARKSAFTTAAGWFHANSGSTYIAALCPVCAIPTMFVIETNPPGQQAINAFLGYGGDPFAPSAGGHLRSQSLAAVRIARTVPAPPDHTVPEFVPDNVASAFLEGLKARDTGMLPSAVYNLRKALERTVRDKNPAGTGGLKNRVKELEKLQMLPSTLVDLAHTVRAEGNVEVHEDEDWSAEQVQELIDFTVLLLTYLYSLPVRISAIAEHRGKPAAAR